MDERPVNKAPKSPQISKVNSQSTDLLVRGVNWRFLKLLDTYSHFLSLGILSGPLEANFSQNAFFKCRFFLQNFVSIVLNKTWAPILIDFAELIWKYL